MSSLVLNGAFSNPDLSVGVNYKTIASSDLPNWSLNNTSQLQLYVARNGGFTISTNLEGYIQVLVLQLNGTNSWLNTGVKQTITFPSYGDYVLSFWVSKRLEYIVSPATITSQTITVSIGSYSQTYNSNGTWVKYYIPFTVFSNTLTLDIRTQTTVLSGDQSMYITGLTVLPANYTQNPLLLNSAIGRAGPYDAVLMSDMVPTMDTANFKVGSSSLAFNAINSNYSQMTNFSVPTTGLTITCWFKVSSVGNSRVFDFGNGQGNDNIAYSPNAGALYYMGTTAYNIAAASGKADNTWHHFVWTMSFALPFSKTSTHTIYIDNVAVYTSATQYYPKVGPRTYCYLGRSNWSADVYTTGNIDDFRTYNSVLLSSDVNTLYYTNSTSTNGMMSYNLTKYYPFEAPLFEWVTNGYFTTSPVYGYGQNYEPIGWKGYAGASGTDVSGYFGIANTTTWTTNNINAAINTATPLPTEVSNFVWLFLADTHITPGIYQDISFSSTGNYILSFWASTTGSGTNTTLNVKTGSNTQTVTIILDTWKKYTVLFTVSSIASATRLNFYTSSQTNSATFLSAISVVYGLATSATNTLLGTSLGNLASGNLVYDATLYGGASIVYDNYKVGTSCLALNASLGNQYVQINNFSVTNKGLTIACWFKYTSVGTSCLFDFGNGAPSGNIIYSPNNGTALYNFTTDQQINTGSGKADGNWHHFVWTMTYASGNPNSTHTIYIDNVATVITGKNYPTLGVKNNSYIGRSAWSADPYATGYVDDFRIYNGVLSANDVGLLYNSTSNISFSGNYTSELVNTMATTVYDASLNGGAYISTTNYITGTGALTMDTSGQFVRLNNSLTTGNGLSFAFWMRGNNGVGQNTLLDYSNGPGGNQKISLGLQNNTLIGQVVNGTSLGTVSFTTAQSSTITGSNTGVAYSTSADRFVICNYNNGNLYFRTGFTGANTSFTTTQAEVICVCLTSDGSRVIWSIRNGNCLYATWNGTTYSGITTINSGTLAGIQGIDMTDDGKILLVSVGINGIGSNGVPNWAYWTGSGYSTYRPILNATTTNHICCGITADGSRIAFADFTSNNLYYAKWNGTNYSNPILIANTGSPAFCLRFSKDGNILFVATTTANTLKYFIWNGSSFGTVQSNTVLNSMGNSPYGLCLDYNNTIYGIGYFVSFLYKTTFQISNQYTSTNFYYEDNLNDNVWRHVAWTIDVSNTTYKYYINSSLVKTDTSALYAFPAPTTRTNNLLGTGTDLSLSYFTGAYDDYRVYNSVLTDFQVSDIYSGKVFGSSSAVKELKNVFKPYSKGIQLVVDLKSLGNDMVEIFQPYTSGIKANATGVYAMRGGVPTDLCNLYQPIQNSFIFIYTGANQTFIVPPGTTIIKVECWGAGGGTQGGGNISIKHVGNGGGGGYTKALFSIKAGTSLTVIVGGGGKTNNTGGASSATYGGGGSQSGNGGDTNWGSASGGGRSAVRETSGLVEIVTAGGGGAGGKIQSAVTALLNTGNGGGGGGSVGGNAVSSFSNEGGKGGSQTVGGAVATGVLSGGTAGSQYTGGSGGLAAGGGGGYYGGGAGNAFNTANGYSFGGGGGGSSFINDGYLYSVINSTSMVQASAPTVANGAGIPTAYANTIGNGGPATNYNGAGTGGTVGQNGLVIITCN